MTQLDLLTTPSARRTDPETSHAATELTAGSRFGRLVLIAQEKRITDGRKVWACICDCGASTKLRGQDLRSGNTRSYGCLLRETRKVAGKKNATHGMTYSPTWNSWQSMIARCNKPSHKSYAHYGGRGITFSERWKDFQNFVADMGVRPEGKTLDRRDNAGHYEPGNCRWATIHEQQRNRSSNRPITAFGDTKLIVEWAEDVRCVVSICAFEKRLAAGWDHESALSIPRYGRYLPELERQGRAMPTGRTVRSDTGRQEREWRAV